MFPESIRPPLNINRLLISSPGELTSTICFIVAIDILYFATKLDNMKEYDAPESNKTIARFELARNVYKIIQHCSVLAGSSGEVLVGCWGAVLDVAGVTSRNVGVELALMNEWC
jgi:hypothetical protein